MLKMKRCEGFYGNLVFSWQKFIRLRKPLALVLRKTAVRHQNPPTVSHTFFWLMFKELSYCNLLESSISVEGDLYGHSEARGFLKGIAMKNQ